MRNKSDNGIIPAMAIFTRIIDSFDTKPPHPCHPTGTFPLINQSHNRDIQPAAVGKHMDKMRIPRMENGVFDVFRRMLFVFLPVLLVFLSSREMLTTGVVNISHSCD